ncbi:uncharacterized protein MONOS_808 [Monocercomonoides exilis]|uniref:uncharacterized protein n=1 Tax=Monocercomonoides exilis TaxID=2049356 RepID=UPI0035597E30|nr:hypothetical protein MONOS_808 [Monocercomonoides exilis]|eukprot:MONOS_808.1-p1 / transcript=MONOS_808.1 / gene=MONOS_808 / organism=Monocercomonoides_exilis_PA203 / gene_product=unspecified product / transcript_product=unspecified product / location=Mono_scaffold00013:178442-178896(-) / protein_length=77 / sequence_SO=supercontig / SO=protein_coding / is_pseudo=false
MEGSQVGCGGTESIYSTWAGGLDGMEITWKVLNLLDDYLSEQGVAYIVFLADNNPKSVREEMKKRGFTSKRVPKAD